jgi:hypothetical protein
MSINHSSRIEINCGGRKISHHMHWQECSVNKRVIFDECTLSMKMEEERIKISSDM